MSITTTELRAEAQPIIAELARYGYNPAIIGGVLRVEALGGVTKDIDIAVRITPAVLGQCSTLLSKLGCVCVHVNTSKYNYRDGFLADFRVGDVNIILYNEYHFPSLTRLVNSFDLNINMFFEEEDVYGEMEVYNMQFNGETVQYAPHHLHVPKPDRITRFRKEYPELDWSNIPNE